MKKSGYKNEFFHYFYESEPLKATLATDAVIGTMTDPFIPGSG